MMFSDPMFYLVESKDLDTEVEKLFHFYRENGYPNYSPENYDIRKEYRKLCDFNELSLVDGKTIKQNMLGLGILWTYFPHWVDVVCGNQQKSLRELWDDDTELRKLIRKTYVWKLKHGEPHWTHNRIRQNAKVYLAKQSVSNFRPTVAKLIYNLYGNNGDILDMSSGFGGRLFGFFASDCKTYTGIEPSSKTCEGLVNMISDLEWTGKSAEIYQTGSEIYNPKWDDSFDLCFTSPPYFDTEKYSDEDTQSYRKYTTLDFWLEGFLKSTIENCWGYTKDDGHMVINIADTTKHKGLEEATVRYAVNCGFEFVDTLQMEMSAISKSKGRKTEPVFVFKKSGEK